MKKTYITSAMAALVLSAGMAHATPAGNNPTGNGPCSPGNASFCDGVDPVVITGPAGPAGPQGPAGPAGASGGFSGIINSPAGIRPDAIGNGTPDQGVVRLRDERGDTFHVVNQNTLFKRADGGTASVNGGDRVSNAHEAELRNRDETVAAVIEQLPEVQDGADGKDGSNGTNGTNGTNGKDGRDGRDFDATDHIASLAAATALGSLQIMTPLAEETTWGIGVGGQFDGDAAIAAGVRYGFSSDMSGYASISTTFEGRGTSYGIGLTGRF